MSNDVQPYLYIPAIYVYGVSRPGSMELNFAFLQQLKTLPKCVSVEVEGYFCKISKILETVRVLYLLKGIKVSKS